MRNKNIKMRRISWIKLNEEWKMFINKSYIWKRIKYEWIKIR